MGCKAIKYYTVSEAARTLRVSTQAVYNWLDDATLAELEGVEGRARLVDAKSVAALLKQRDADAA